MAETRSKILNNDRPAVVGRQLARLLGTTEALVLQTLHYEVLGVEEEARDPRRKRMVEHLNWSGGFWWVVGTYDYLASYKFDFTTSRVLRRTLEKLESDGYVISEAITSHGGRQAGKRYRVNHTRLEGAWEKQEPVVRLEGELDLACDTDGNTEVRTQEPGNAGATDAAALQPDEHDQHTEQTVPESAGCRKRQGTVPKTAGTPAQRVPKTAGYGAENGSLEPLLYKYKNPVFGDLLDSTTTEKKEEPYRSSPPSSGAAGNPVVEILTKAGIWLTDAVQFAAQYTEQEIRDYIDSNRMIPADEPAAMLASRLKRGTGIPEGFYRKQEQRYVPRLEPQDNCEIKPEVAERVRRLEAKAKGVS
jgi:hypothetical protein